MNSPIIEVFFDVETKKLFGDIEDKDPANLGVSIVSVYKRLIDSKFREIEGEIQSFWEEDFKRMWPIFEEAQRIVGFNSLKFDVPALKPYAPENFIKLPHFDIMQKFKEITNHRISLDSLAKSNLGRNKIDTGINAIFYWEKGDPKSLAKLQKYCEDDVLLTRDLYDFGLKNKELTFFDKWNTLRKIRIDFSHPEDIEPSQSQTSLF